MKIKRSPETTELQAALRTMQEAKQIIERAERDHALAQELAIKLMEQSGHKTTVIDSADGTKIKVTVVEQERLKIDDTELRSAIGDKAYNLVTVRKVSQDLLKAAVTKGTVSADVVAKVTTISKSAPYIRISAASAETE